MNKLISVIMPVKNGEKYLKEAIEGIKRQKMDVEIIVVNDGSTDSTEQIAKGTGCVVINHAQSKGQVAAKNTGIKNAHGEYIIFHDGDDIMNNNALEVLYDTLEADQSLAAVMAKVKDFVSPDIEEPTQESVKADPYYGLFTGAVLMRHNVFALVCSNTNSSSPVTASSRFRHFARRLRERSICSVKSLSMMFLRYLSLRRYLLLTALNENG